MEENRAGTASYAEVIGDPIAHSQSPLIHLFWLQCLGLAGDYRAVRVAPEGLAAYLAERRGDPLWRGCNVTIPHKETVAALLDAVTDSGVGAVNCIVPEDGRLLGLNFDATGLGECWPATLGAGDEVAILGAGGAARAAAAALRARSVQLRIIARDPAKARRIDPDAGIFSLADAAVALRGCAGLVNASPLGMAGFPAMPEAILEGVNAIRSGGFALDMVYRPLETALIARAGREGLATIDGLTMLIAQAAHAFERFFGAAAPRARDGALRELLTR
jgi:shikimate dehydrogenase